MTPLAPPTDTLEVMQRVIGGCREETKGGGKCWEPSEFVLWGKLLPPEALGPRCYDHAEKHLGRGVGDPQWAVVDLRRLSRELAS